MEFTTGRDYSDASRLLKWFEKNKRDLPWRSNRTAWFTLLSEVMLQQTRVDQMLPYFHKFVSRFPTITDFADASLDEIFLLWEGLGYYSRARNLHNTCKLIVEKYNGEIPSDYETLLTIRGIGPYTAAAISSLVFNQPKAALDGNIVRVLSRFYGLTDDVTKIKTKKQLQLLADAFLVEHEPGKTNEALMELGATVCKPRNPLCSQCPLEISCLAFKMMRTEVIPYKTKKPKVPHIDIGIGIVFNKNGEILIAKRPDEKMLGGLWEFPGGKKEPNETIEETIHREFEEEVGIKIKLNMPLKPIKHAYSHFKITLHSWMGEWISGTPKPLDSKELKWVLPSDLCNYAFPKANRKLIDYILEQV